MPNKEFLEKYPLYRKFRIDKLGAPVGLGHVGSLPKVPIKMACPTCRTDQTFAMTNSYEGGNKAHMTRITNDMEFHLEYTCVHCNKFIRSFSIRVVDTNKKLVQKIGQFPPWDISTDPNIERLLGSHADFFKKGLICESQSYGIGAFAYYRRIVEEIIGELLEEISEIMDGNEKEKFLKAIEETKKTQVTQDKIALVKDLLPPILRPKGMNPLSVLHSTVMSSLT